MRVYEEKLVPKLQDVYTGTTCDKCGVKSIPLDYTTPQIEYFNFEFNEGEESELLLRADICENCLDNGVLTTLCDIIKSLRELIPNASVRASTMLDWEATGVYEE